MEIRKSNRNDVQIVLSIYESARKHMLEHGNPNQWSKGYPDEKIILLDIEDSNHFICVDGNRSLGCFAVIEGEDPTYRVIVRGKWLNNEPYAVIHRLAVLEHGKGIGSICIDWCLNRHKNIRADTHPDNTSMRELLCKKGFQYCGVIYNRWGDERLAFQRV